MNKALLKSKIIANGDTQETLAIAMDTSLSSLNSKINGTNADFRQSEIKFIKDRYDLSAKDVDEIFFNKLVSKKDTSGQPNTTDM